MLKIFRHKNVTKVVLWGILILILPAFVLWGTGSGGRSKDKGPTFVGLIDNKKVTFDDFAESLTAVRVQIILNYFNQPKVLDKLLSSKAFLGKLAWDRLLMVKQAGKDKIKISNKDVVEFLRSHPIFLRNGSFDDKAYIFILKNSMGLAPRMFEEIARANLAIQRLNDQLTKEISVTDEEILEAYKADNEKFDEEKFKKDKGDYSKKALAIKKSAYLENWLRGLEQANKINIDFEDYEKYYR